MKSYRNQVNLLTAVVFLLAACFFIFAAVVQTGMVQKCLSGVAAFFALVSSGCFYKAYSLKKQSKK